MTLDTNRPRVLKIQSPKAESPSMAVGRLKHEASVAQSVHNPPKNAQQSPLSKADRAGVVQIFECGCDCGLTFLAMERFSNCRSLRQFLSDSESSADLIEHLPLVAERLAGALASLHWAAWLYGALKPNNVLINEEWELRLIDLTGCTALGGHWKQWVPMAGSGLGQTKLVGSPYYVSPEQIRRQPLDARSDVYSFGCFLFEVIEGRVPYTGKTANELLNKHLQAKVPRITRHSRYVTDELADLVAAMMEKQPDHRPRDMMTVQHEMRSVFQKADPVDWNTLFGRGAEDDSALDLAAQARVADSRFQRLSTGKSSAGDQNKPRGWLARQSDRVAAATAKYGRRRWVQVTTVGLLMLLVGWIALRSESTAAEERVLAEFARVLSGLNQITTKGGQVGNGSAAVTPDMPTIDELQSQAKQAVDLFQREFAEPNSRKPIQMELHWASQVVTEAVAEARQPDRLSPVALGSLRTHVANASRYIQQARERRELAGPLGLKRVYESDLFFWSIVVLDVLGAAWIVKLLVVGRRRRALE